MAKKAIRIRRGTKIHCIYEAAATHDGAFTAHDILAEVKKQFPKCLVEHIGNTFSMWAPAGFIKKTGTKKRGKGAMRTTTAWVIDLKKPQPVIFGDKPKKRTVKPRKKKPVLPPEVDALTLGAAVIDYINHLQSRVKDLALDVRSVKDKGSTQEQALQRELNVKQHEIDGLKKNVSDLKTKLAQANRRKGLKLDPIIEHRKRSHGG